MRRYESAYGVVALKWILGDPGRTTQPVVVEVWRSELSMRTRADMPTVRKVVGYDGQLTDPRAGEVRRYAELGHNWWSKVVALDGWDS